MGTNQTFKGSDPFWANACVGENGNPGILYYAFGFSRAAEILKKYLIDNEGRYVDELIYPLCFSIRHSIELRLKNAVGKLKQIEELRKNMLVFDLDCSHDIGNIWSFLLKKSEHIDERYKVINNKITPIISDIALVDATGQTFRYPFNNDSQKHLAEISCINIFPLMDRYRLLNDALTELEWFNQYLFDEYATQTFTAKLSRQKIFELANELPPKDKWFEDSFDQIRSDFIDQLGVSRNEFSKSLNLIQRHFEFAPLIGLSIPLLGVSDEDVVEFAKFWLKWHEPSLNVKQEIWGGDCDSFVRIIARDKHTAKIEEEVWSLVETRINVVKLAGYFALFYFAEDSQFSEWYVFRFEKHKRILRDGQNKEDYFHILKKTSGLENIVKSLHRLKKNNLIEKITFELNLDSIEGCSWVTKYLTA